VWHESEAAVSVEAVIANLLKNAATAKDIIRRVVPEVGPPRACPCPRLLENAIITPPDRFPPKVRKRLDLLIGKYFPAAHGPARRPAPGRRQGTRRRG
jgi:5'-methylthioadenosine phosphorylase